MIIYDNFLDCPDAAVADAHKAGFRDLKYKDGAVYPDISPGACTDLRQHVIDGIQALAGFDIDVKEFFYRRSKKHVERPHWAHTDAELSQFVALIYLADPPADVDAGTVILEHVDGWRGQPQTDEQLEQWKADTKDPSKWNVLERAQMVKNRIVLHRADELHAAMPVDGFGDGDDARLVLVVFFDQKPQFIRRATPADGPELTELFMEFAQECDFASLGVSTNPVGWCAEMTNEIANNPLFGCFVAVDNGQVVAAIAAAIGSSWLDRRQMIASERFWYVTPKHRKSRMGLKLLGAIEEWARASGADAIDFIALSTSDELVQRVYEKRGFRKLETHFMKVL